MPPGLLAPDQLVEADAEHARDQLQESEALTLPPLAEIRCQRLRALVRLMPAPVIFVAQCRREAFLVLTPRHVARERFAPHDGREHASLRPRALEAFNLLIGPARLGRGRRAQDDQEL